MRYEKTEALLRLALEMQGTAEGLCLADIQDRMGIGRRTAERMRDAILRIFPQAEEVPTGERIKRWRLPSRTLNGAVGFSPEELADLHGAIDLLNSQNLTAKAASLEGLATKIKALIKPEAARRIEPDLEALMEAEGIAMRPGPRQNIDPHVLEALRDAIKQCRMVTLHYLGRDSSTLSQQDVHPYGFLYGNRHYLVAYNTNPYADDYRLFSLANIKKVVITPTPFERDPDFSLQAYAENSFGVFQEEPFDVVWRFSPAAAKDAKEYMFHPTQTMEEQDDGALIVRFRAGGLLEMAWHLYTWGDEVEVLEPEELIGLFEGQRGTL